MGCLCAFLIMLGILFVVPFVIGVVSFAIPAIPILIGICLIIFGVYLFGAMWL